MSKIVTFFIAGILFVGSPLQAQTDTATIADTLQLESVVVTGTKIPVSQRETSKPVTVISREEIERSTSRNFSQLLNQLSGIRVNNSNSTPSADQILFLEGAGGGYTLVLMDGMPVRDPSGVGGAIDLRLLPLQNIERIEVLKGNQSTLYGTDAVAGVINLITRTEQDRTLVPSGRLSYGAYNTFQGNAGVSGAVGNRLQYNFRYTRESSDGISAAAPPEGGENFDKDGYSLDGFHGRVSFEPLEGLSISPVFSYSAYDGDYDADAFQDADNSFGLDMLNPGVQLAFRGERVRLNSNYNYTRTERFFLSEFGEDEYTGRFHDFDTFGSYRFTDNLNLLGGIHYQEGNMPDTESPDEDLSTSFISPYATVHLRDLNGFSAELGYRLNHHSEYGGNSTYSIAPSFRITDRVRLFASYGTGFKAPTLNELFGPFGPNPELDPETSREYRLGTEAYLMQQSLKLEVNYFDREIDNLIVYLFDPGYLNRDREEASGFEFTANWMVTGRFSVGGHYNYLTGKTITLDGEGNETDAQGLIRKPEHTLGFNAGYRTPNGVNLRIDGEYVGQRTDLFFNPENNFAAEEVTLDSYLMVNLHAEYSLADERLILFGTVRNLLDSGFMEVYGFNTMGIHADAGIRFRF